MLFVIAVVLAGSGIVAAAVHDDGGTSATSTVATTVPPPSETTTTTAPTATTTTAAPGATTTSTPGAATTTTRRAATTTTTRRTTTTTAAAGPTSTSVAAKPLCTAAQIEVTAATDQASYLPSQTVTVNSTIRNRSGSTCYYTGYNFGVAFADSAGQAYGGQSLVADVLEATPVAPGERITHSVTWDHRQCPVAITCGALPAGSYSAKVTWVFPGGPYERTVAIVLA